MSPRFGILVTAIFLLAGCAGYTEVTKDPVIVARYQSAAQADVFTVAGCVRHPGRFLMSSGEPVTLFGAIERAGGTISGNYLGGEPAASLKDIRVLRLVNGRVVEFKLNLYPGKAGRDFPIRAGDQIRVPQVFF